MILAFLPFFVLQIVCAVAPEIIFKKGCEPIEMSENKIFLDVRVSGASHKFDIDIGKSESTFQFAAAKPDGEFSIGNQLFSGRSVLYKREDTFCQTGQNGNLGYEFFRRSQQIFLFDFDALTLCNIDGQDLSAYFDQHYTPIDADFRKNGIYIPILIKWKVYKVKLDTGYTGSVFINNSAAEPFIKEPSRTYNSLGGNFSVYPNKWITLGKHYYNSSIEVSDKGDSCLGMGFIKGFNWIIDFNRHKVYFKKNGNSLDAQNIFPPQYSVSLAKGKLVITSKAEKATKYQLGDIISSVNGTAVTGENICQIKGFFHTVKNWGDQQIQVTDR